MRKLRRLRERTKKCKLRQKDAKEHAAHDDV